MLTRMDRLLLDEGSGILQQLARELAPVVAHRIHEQALAIREGQRHRIEHRRRHRIAAQPGLVMGGLGREMDIARGDGEIIGGGLGGVRRVVIRGILKVKRHT